MRTVRFGVDVKAVGIVGSGWRSEMALRISSAGGIARGVEN